MKKELWDGAIELKHETEKAYLINDGGDEDHWIPKAQCELGPKQRDGTYEITMPMWLAKEKGLI